MPSEKCMSPDSATIVTQNVKVTGNEVQVRNSPSLLGTVLTKVNVGDVLLRIECASSQNSGYYWDRVVLPSGAKGYIARNYITQIDDVTNANATAVTNTTVNLRNGPGTIGTSVVTTLVYGQTVTIIEKGAYDGINDYNWVRVKLSNGTQGYIASKYLTEVGGGENNTSTNTETNTETNNQTGGVENYIISTINCSEESSVRVRAEATTSSSIITSLSRGATVTIIQENVATADGYNWDKIVTGDGLEGYIANKYLNKKTDINTEEQPEKSSASNGYDVDGDGKINSKDLFDVINFLQDHMGEYSNSYDINNDNKVNSQDLYQIIEYLQNQ